MTAIHVREDIVHLRIVDASILSTSANSISALSLCISLSTIDQTADEKTRMFQSLAKISNDYGGVIRTSILPCSL